MLTSPQVSPWRSVSRKYFDDVATRLTGKQPSPPPRSQKSSTLHTNLNLTLLPSALSPSTPPQLFPLIIFVGSSLLSFQFCPWYIFVCQLFFCIRLPWLLSTVERKCSERNFFALDFLPDENVYVNIRLVFIYVRWRRDHTQVENSSLRFNFPGIITQHHSQSSDCKQTTTLTSGAQRTTWSGHIPRFL